MVHAESTGMAPAGMGGLVGATASSAAPRHHSMRAQADAGGSIAACPPSADNEPTSTHLIYLGPTSGGVEDSLALAAQLTDATRYPISNKAITFTLGGQSAVASTDANGLANVSLTPSGIPGSILLNVSYAGDSGSAAISTSVK